jgi:hypothetical protein
MKITVNVNGLEQVRKALADLPKKANFATVAAMNKSLEWAETDVRREMRRVFDNPTPWVLNSLRMRYATTREPVVRLAFKDRNSVESSRTMVEPHVYGGQRHFKAMEARLMGIGLLPAGYNVVPGAAARLNGFGNMSQGQISQILNVLGAYTESGFNKANLNTIKRLAKGGLKGSQYGQYGFVYWVNRVGNPDPRTRHLQPGVYQRVKTGLGSTLKPVLIFVKRANYKPRLDFYGIAKRTVNERFASEFDKAFALELSKSAPSMR